MKATARRRGVRSTPRSRRYSDGLLGPAPVKTFPPDAYGLYDMEGNVSEWVEDRWHDNPCAGATARPNPGCERRVVRGGSGSDPGSGQFQPRLSVSAAQRVGFRLCARGSVNSHEWLVLWRARPYHARLLPMRPGRRKVVWFT